MKQSALRLERANNIFIGMKYQTLSGAITPHVIYLQLSTTTTNVTSGDQLVSLFEKNLEGK